MWWWVRLDTCTACIDVICVLIRTRPRSYGSTQAQLAGVASGAVCVGSVTRTWCTSNENNYSSTWLGRRPARTRSVCGTIAGDRRGRAMRNITLVYVLRYGVCDRDTQGVAISQCWTQRLEQSSAQYSISGLVAQGGRQFSGDPHSKGLDPNEI